MSINDYLPRVDEAATERRLWALVAAYADKHKMPRRYAVDPVCRWLDAETARLRAE